MPTIKTIKPAGGGDYTTLAAWWSARKTSGNADEWAECYSGGSLGALTMSGMTATPNASTYPKIYAASGEEHGGDKTAGAYSTASLRLLTNYARCEQIRVGNLASGGGVVLANTGTYAIGVLTHDIAAAGISVSVSANATVTIRNCLSMDNTTNILLESQAVGSATVLATEVSNCTCSGGAYGIRTVETNIFGGPPSVNATIKNGVACGGGTADFSRSGTTGTWTTANNASEDATADDFGGTGNLINQDPNDLFEDPSNGDFQPKANSAMIAAANLSSDFTSDILGSPRPPAGPWDIGAFEYVAEYDISYVYDPLGNRLVKNAYGQLTTSTYDPANQLKTSLDASGTTTYTYDQSGNQRLVMAPSGQITTTTWNYENQPILVEKPTGARVTTLYNADNRRVVKET